MHSRIKSKSQNQHLLFIGNYLSIEKYNKNIWHYLAERLAQSGWTVITSSNKENRVLRLLDMFLTILKHRKHYTVAQVDVFSSRGFIFAEFCSWLLKFLHKRIVLTLHGGGLVDFSERSPKRLSQVLNRADKVVTPSIFLKQNLLSFRNDIILIPNPIDVSDAIFKVRSTVVPNLIWVRTFHETYNPNLAIDVLVHLVPDYLNLHLIMLGPDSGDGSLDRFIQKANDANVMNNIEIVGGVPHIKVPVWLSQADIFINTTNYDAAPRSLLEAMASGLCVVSTNVGGVPFIIDDNEDGLLVPPDDPYAMASAVRRVLTEPDLAEKLSSNARLKAEQHDWSFILPQWEQLFSELLADKAP